MKREAGENMDANAVMTAIGSLGFPIVACIGMGWFIVWSTKVHKEETSKMSEAVNNNTIVLQKLMTLTGKDENL